MDFRRQRIFSARHHVRFRSQRCHDPRVAVVAQLLRATWKFLRALLIEGRVSLLSELAGTCLTYRTYISIMNPNAPPISAQSRLPRKERSIALTSSLGLR